MSSARWSAKRRWTTRICARRTGAEGAGKGACAVKVGLVHGKMNKAQKEDTLSAFYAGALDVLVATTVIEVGVNVPTRR